MSLSKGLGKGQYLCKGAQSPFIFGKKYLGYNLLFDIGKLNMQLQKIH